MNLGRSIVKMFGAQMISSAASFVGIAIFARTIGAYQLGIFFLFQAVVNLLSLPADAGLRGALEKRISEGNRGPDFLATMALMKLVPLAVVLIGILLFRGKLQAYIGADVVVYVVVALIVDEAYFLVQAVLRGELRVGDAADMMAMRQTLWVVLGTIAVWGLDFGARGIIYAYILGALVAFLYGLHLRATPLGTPSAETARSLFDYAKFDIVAGAGSKLYSWLDVLVIGFFLTQTEVGAYETAWRLSVAAVMFGIAIRTSIFPQFSDWSRSENVQRISSTLTVMITGSLFLVIPAFVGVLLFSNELLGIIFGQEFVIASVALVILMGHRIFQALNQTVGRTLQAIDRPDLAAYATGAGIAANVVLNVALVSQFGIEGAAAATFLSFALMTLIRTRYLTRYVPVRFAVRDIGWCVLAAIVMGIALYAIKTGYEVTNAYELVAVVAVGVGIYFAVVMLSDSLRGKIVDGARSAAD